jgi:hypothetical protein
MHYCFKIDIAALNIEHERALKKKSPKLDTVNSLRHHGYTNDTTHSKVGGANWQFQVTCKKQPDTSHHTYNGHAIYE